MGVRNATAARMQVAKAGNSSPPFSVFYWGYRTNTGGTPIFGIFADDNFAGIMSTLGANFYCGSALVAHGTAITSGTWAPYFHTVDSAGTSGVGNYTTNWADRVSISANFSGTCNLVAMGSFEDASPYRPNNTNAVAVGAVWDVEFGQTEHDLLVSGVDPRYVRPNDLVSLTYFNQLGSIVDVISGNAWTVTGTPTIFESRYFTVPEWIGITSSAAAGGVSFPVVTEAISFTQGTLGVSVGELIAVTPAGIEFTDGVIGISSGSAFSVNPASIAFAQGTTTILDGRLIDVSPATIAFTQGALTIDVSGAVSFPVIPANIAFADGIVTILDGRLIQVNTEQISFTDGTITIDNGQVVEAATKGGGSMSLRQMRALEKAQLQALLRDDDEILALMLRMRRRGPLN